ncbi:hypothetical protein DFH07DRAFT_780296 [Mycena maculata]|uniref:Uncharacterized protein n=1 Tax=Mycena maculata TaxID=230809 RepID=A0AAD7I3U9_9AGAR|nr:hypothetical protein DFH07DRAFT_780296 [Mycena maculata]
MTILTWELIWIQRENSSTFSGVYGSQNSMKTPILDNTERSWALAMTALSNVWEEFDTQAWGKYEFTPEFVRLVCCTVSTSLRVRYTIWCPSSERWDDILFPRACRAVFASQLGAALIWAAQEARDAIAAVNMAPDHTHSLQRVADFLDAVGRKIGIDFEPGSGEVEILGEVKPHTDWDDLKNIFMVIVETLEKSLGIDR